jgi:hypothetical protein
MTFAVLQSPAVRDRQARWGSALARTFAITLLVLLSIVPAAGADVGATIIERCTHGQSLSGYSQQDYRRALQELPAEVEEYSDCANLIRRAQLAGAGGGAGGGEALTPIVSTPAERAALHAASRTAAPVRLAGQLVRPGVVKANVASALSTLPTPLLALLAFLLACALTLAGRPIAKRVRAYRSH